MKSFVQDNRKRSKDRASDAELNRQRRRLQERMHNLAPASPPGRVNLDRLPRQKQPPSFTGHTYLEPNYPIRIAVELNWEGQRHRRVDRFCGKAGVKVATEVVLDTILVHELGHELICPKQTTHAYSMRLAAAGVLKRLDKYTPALCQYTANLVADILVNVVNGSMWRSPANSTYDTGLLLSWYDQGASPYYASTLMSHLRRLVAAILGKRKFTPWFEVFVRSQAAFLPHAEAGYHYLLAPYLRQQNPPPRRAFSQKIETDGGGKSWDRELTVEEAAERVAELIQDPTVIATEDAWPALTRDICWILAPFLPETPPPVCCLHPLFEYRTPEDAAREAQCPPAPTLQDSGQKNGAKKGETQGQEGVEADTRTSKRTASPPESGGTILTKVPWVSPDGKRISLDTDRPEALDALYTLWASHTRLDYRTRSEKRMPQVPLMSLFQLKDKLKGLEPLTSILFCIDCSGSMMGGRAIAPKVPWGEGSFYHFALLAVYGVAKWLQSEKRPYQVNVIAFSDSTRATGWCSASKLREKLRETALSPEAGGTVLRRQVLEKHLSPTRGCLVMMFSDGQIYNTDEIIELFTQPEIQERCLPVLIHTNPSGESLLSRPMREHGFKVYDVKVPGDIPAYVGPTAAELLG